MNLNRIINMVINQITRRMINGGINKGINLASGFGKSKPSSSDPSLQSQQDAKRARKQSRVVQKSSKF